MKSAPLTNAEKQARYRQKQRLEPLRKAMGLEPITLHLTENQRAQVLALIANSTEAASEFPEGRAAIIDAMTSQ
jgi:hypothetical protein